MSATQKAIDLARHTGWRVFPVSITAQAGGKTLKRPLTRWTVEAYSEPEAITKLWTRNYHAAIGVATGMKNGLYVIDVDNPEALETAPRAVRKGLAVPTNREGGMHYYFGSPADGEPVRNSAENGLDVRGDGGFVVVWHPELVMGATLKALPSSVAAWARERSSSVAPQNSFAQPIYEGSRETALVSMAGTMHKRGFVPEAIQAALWFQNKAVCVPPLDDEAIERIANSVTRYSKDEIDDSAVRQVLQNRQKAPA